MNFLRTRTEKATALAILFHVIGLAGIFIFGKQYLSAATGINLILMFALIVWTQPELNLHFFAFFLLCFVSGFAVEIIGVNSGLLFGEYVYAGLPGPAHHGVPLIIGVNWFIILYCCGISVNMILERLSLRLAAITNAPPRTLKFFSVITDSAMLAVFFDWIMEPAAVKLDYWHWLGAGTIPFYNYVCWFVISAFIMIGFAFLRFNKHNKFAVHLLLVMAMFFLIVRNFL